MGMRALFATQVYAARLRDSGTPSLNQQLLRECLQLRHDDVAGRRWSKHSYPGGYTSYGSQCRMQIISPTFATLAQRLARHVKVFTAALDLDLANRPLSMTDCWVNIMPRGVVHGLHLHPHATISGTYYVRTPKACAALKLEDPRLDRYMASPPRLAKARISNLPWVTIPAETGQLVLFESWLRHEVPPNQSASERISISFNYGWF
jgi:uncharacterized protein (TIGR02466 family)